MSTRKPDWKMKKIKREAENMESQKDFYDFLMRHGKNILVETPKRKIRLFDIVGARALKETIKILRTGIVHINLGKKGYVTIKAYGEEEK